MTTTIKRPEKIFSFSDWSRSRPRDQQPGDRLDAQISDLIDAIRSTQDALAQIRRDDGTLNVPLPANEKLEELADKFRSSVSPAVIEATSRAAQAKGSEQNAQLFAQDAEKAASVTAQLANSWTQILHSTKTTHEYVQKVAATIDTEAMEAENWATFSKAQADNAIAAKNEALQWAEYLAGPVVDASKAPAYIAGSPFPHGLYYQPVEGGVAGLWSAKWWALYAQNLVGNAGFYYLGAWDHGPLPGEVHPETGRQVPNPIAPGSLYYDSETQQLYVWNGTSWEVPTQLTKAYTGHFVYFATGGQTVFSGADHNGATPAVADSPSEVFLNGVRLVEGDDFTIDKIANSLTLKTAATVNSVVQWDLLLSGSMVAGGTVNIFKLDAITPDGTTQNFSLTYSSGTPAAVGTGSQLQVSQDGCIQEPGIDYTASGSTIHFATAPPVGARIWMIWFKPGTTP